MVTQCSHRDRDAHHACGDWAPILRMPFTWAAEFTPARFGLGAAPQMAHGRPALSHRVAKCDVFATRNSLKSRERPRLTVLISKLRATTPKLWPGHQPTIQEFRRVTPDQTGRPTPAALCLTSRDFVPWRFLDAAQLSVPNLSCCRRPKTSTTADTCVTATHDSS